MSGTAILTNAGLSKIASATPIDQLRITDVAIGDGVNPLDPNATALVNEVYRDTASEPIRSAAYPDTIIFELTVPPSVGGFTTREIGVFDVDGDMVAVGTLDEVAKPNDGINLTARINIKLSNSSDVDVFYVDTTVEDALNARSRLSDPITLTDGQSEVTFAGFNASLSSYYLSSPLGSDVPDKRLFAGKHYTFADNITETITLDISVEAGWDIYAASLDPTGKSQILTPGEYLDRDDLVNAYAVPNDAIVTVTNLGRAVYRIYPAGTTVNIGDIEMVGGQVAVLQPDQMGAFNVKWFDALAGASNQNTPFENAAARALVYAKTSTSSNVRGLVRVPVGNWYLTSKTTNSATWLVDHGAEFQSPTNYSSNNVDNISYLNGDVIKLFARGDSVMHLGSSNVQWLQDVRTSILGTSVLSAVSSNGKVGVMAAARSSDKTVASEGTIPFKSYVLNDNETTKGVVYGMYKEAIRWPNAGTTLAEESNVTTYGTLQTVYPNQSIGNAVGVCANYWVGGPVGSGPLDSSYEKVRTSAAFVTTGGSAFDTGGNRLGFDSILVVLHDSMATSPEREVFRLPTDTKQSYYSDTGTRRVYTNARNNSSNGEYDVVVRSVGGIDTTYTFKSAAFQPAENATKNLGVVGGRWLNAYLQNAPDVVSDKTKKTSIRELTDNELAAGLALARDVQLFKWVDEVAQKGEADSYIHTSVMAQEAWQIMIDNDLDPTDYGFISNSANGWSVSPSELSMLMCAALVKNQDLLEQRIAALENV